MHVLWTPAAAGDLEQISTYLSEQNPAVSTGIVRQIYDAASGLNEFPLRGRPGRKHGTRELVLSPLPYIIVYTVRKEEQRVHIIRVLHGSRRWP